MELDMDECDSKMTKEVALHCVDKCEWVKGPCEQSSNDDLALFVKQFKRAFRNKEKVGKWFGSSSTKRKNQYTIENCKRYTEKDDRGLLKISGPCFACEGNRH